MRLLYTGPSLLDPGVPIFVAATGPSTNRKTGPMTQIWIQRADMTPHGAVARKQDAAICGDCRHRGLDGATRTCYVNVTWAPGGVYRAFRDGRYTDQRDAVNPLADEHVRVGAYGDPAALPAFFWTNLLHAAAGWTGYTHQWRRPAVHAHLRRYFMASVDSVQEQQEARRAGWRTFRVRTPDSPLLPGEITCPASEEAGKRTTCLHCQLCDGYSKADHRVHRRKDIAILAHGADQAFGEQQQQGLPW